MHEPGCVYAVLACCLADGEEHEAVIFGLVFGVLLLSYPLEALIWFSQLSIRIVLEELLLLAYWVRNYCSAKQVGSRLASRSYHRPLQYTLGEHSIKVFRAQATSQRSEADSPYFPKQSYTYPYNEGK
jgi:hypothetical protein